MSTIAHPSSVSREDSLRKYQTARENVAKALQWLRGDLNDEQNTVLDVLLKNVETCTDMERNGAFSDGFDAGRMCALEDVGRDPFAE